MRSVQGLRDGLAADSRRLLWKAVGSTLLAVLQLGLMVFALWYALHDGDYAKGVFYAVLYLWTSK